MNLHAANQNLSSKKVKRIIGIGAGPSNLSLAALSKGIPELQVQLLEKSAGPQWHPGMQIPDAELQVSFLKDLVTLVDPTNQYSFLSFLKDKKRIYRALVANRSRTSRMEFERYLEWVSKKLECVDYNVAALNVEFDGKQINIETSAERQSCDGVAIGTGLIPKTPDIPGMQRLGIHSSKYMTERDKMDFNGKTVAVVGGGQSGAEIVLDLLSTYGPSVNIQWINKRLIFLPLDDSPFVNEHFFPGYVDFFESLAQPIRGYLSKYFCHASDGISTSTLERLYEKCYDLHAVEEFPNVLNLHVATRMMNADAMASGIRLQTYNEVTQETDVLLCDHLFFATGYGFQKPSFIESLIPGELVIRSDRSIEWEGQDTSPIHIQNSSVEQFSLAEPNLSLLAWRSARILNSLNGKDHYELEESQAALNFSIPQPLNIREIAV